MNQDYKNFGERMGSFEDTLELTDDSIKHANTIVTRNRSAALAHVGVLGMKWGHHVNANTVNKATKTGQDLVTLGQTVNKGGFSKKAIKEARSLSDDDLKQLTNRLNLENNYMNARQQQSGREKVERMLSTAGATLAVASSAAVLYQAIHK